MSYPTMNGQKPNTRIRSNQVKRYTQTVAKVETEQENIAIANITVDPVTFESWAFTIKKTGSGEPTYEDCADVVTRLSAYGNVRFSEVERDSKGRLHMHGIILLRPKFWRKHLCFDGYHTHLKPVFHESGWLKYINKEKKLEVYDSNAREFKPFYLFGPSGPREAIE